MASFTLDDIRNAAEAQYGSTDITLDDGFTVKLLNPLRLPKGKRDALMNLQKESDRLEKAAEIEADLAKEEGREPVEVDEKDQGDTMRESIRLVANTEHGAEKLIEWAGDDLGLLATIFKQYGEGSQVGEASGSQN